MPLNVSCPDCKAGTWQPLGILIKGKVYCFRHAEIREKIRNKWGKKIENEINK